MSTSSKEIKLWVEKILETEVSIDGISYLEKGNNYLSDVSFVKASNQSEIFDLVLKCSERSEIMRVKIPIKKLFDNEIWMYKEVFPAFLKFEAEKTSDKVHITTPKFFGFIVDDNIEIIALENLRTKNYKMSSKSEPLPKEIVLLILEEYAKLHATSLAMADQQPEKFNSLVSSLSDAYIKILEVSDVRQVISRTIDDLAKLLENDLDPDVVRKWREFKNQLDSIFEDIANPGGLRVVVHSSCWSNNFLYRLENNRPTSVAVLDWQMSRLASPISDLSYFLFCSISSDDLNNMNTFLRFYYDKVTQKLLLLGSNPERLFAFNDFMKEWNRGARFGIMNAALHLKMQFAQKDEAVDVAEASQDGYLGKCWMPQISDLEGAKNRIGPVIQYAVQHELI